MNQTLHTLLAAAHADATTLYVIEWAGARVANVKHGFHGAYVRASLTDAMPHTLRHTAVTWMMQKGVSIWDAAGFAGMTPEMVARTYGHHNPTHLRGAAQVLER